jgi:hypothetical protein
MVLALKYTVSDIGVQHATSAFLPLCTAIAKQDGAGVGVIVGVGVGVTVGVGVGGTGVLVGVGVGVGGIGVEVGVGVGVGVRVGVGVAVGQGPNCDIAPSVPNWNTLPAPSWNHLLDEVYNVVKLELVYRTFPSKKALYKVA